MSTSKVNLLIDVFYPRKTSCEKASYVASAAAYVSLFATNLVSIAGIATIPHLPLVNLGLAGGSFLLSLPGGALKGIKLGLGRECLQTLPLGIIALLASIGVGTVGSGVNAMTRMSTGILATQGISSLYYVFGACCDPMKALQWALGSSAKNRDATDAALQAAHDQLAQDRAKDQPLLPAADASAPAETPLPQPPALADDAVFVEIGGEE